MEFKGKIRAPLLRSWILANKTIAEEVKINISKAGWLVRTVDPAHTAMLELDVHKHGWEEFKAHEDIEVGLDLDKLLYFLDIAYKNTVVSIEVDMERNRMYAKINNVTRTMGLLDTDGMSDPKPVNYHHDIKAQIPHFQLAEALKSIKNDCDLFALAGDDSGLKFYDWINDNMHQVNIPHTDLTLNGPRDDTVLSVFPLDYLKGVHSRGRINGCFSWLLKGSMVDLSFGNDYPLHLSAECEDWNFSFWLAPTHPENRGYDDQELEKIWARCMDRPVPVVEPVDLVPEPVPVVPDSVPEPELVMVDIPQSEGFTIGQKVKSAANEVFTVSEVNESFLTVKDIDDVEYCGLLDSFSPVHGGY